MDKIDAEIIAIGLEKTLNAIQEEIASRSVHQLEAIREASRTNTAELRLQTRAIVRAVFLSAHPDQGSLTATLTCDIMALVYGPDPGGESDT